MIAASELTKLYYSIGEVAEMLNVATSNIRFWEKQFPQLAPKKNNKGNRMFSPKEILLLQRIYQLIHEEGYTIEGAKKALKSKKQHQTSETSAEFTTSDVAPIVADLEKIKQRLIAMKSMR